MDKLFPPFDSEADLRAALQTATSELLAADMNHGVYLALEEISRAYKREHSRLLLFLAMVFDALQLQTVLGLCRVYDADPQSNGLPVVIKRIEAGGAWPDASVKDDLHLVSKRDPVVRRLRAYRNHVLADTNQKFALGAKTLPDELKLLRKDVGVLIERAMGILSRYSGSYMSSEINRLQIPDEQIKFVFDAAKEKIDVLTAGWRHWYEERGVNPDVFLDSERMFEEWKQKNHLDLD